MSVLVRIVCLLALIVWLGAALFLSFVVAPAMFHTFPVVEAGRAVGALFPIYYKVGYAAGTAVLVAAVILRSMSPDRASWAAVAGLAAIMLAATLYAGVVVQPRAQALRPQLHDVASPPAVKEEFDRLHRRAVQLNTVVLIGGLTVAVIVALRLKP